MTGTEAADPRLATVLGVQETGPGLRSPLYLFMRRNFAALQADFEEKGPRWEARTKAFAEAGLTDRTGKPPTKRTAQYTWYQVKQDMEQAGLRARGRNAPVPPPPAPSSEAGDEHEAERAGPRFGFAKPRV